MTLPTQAPITDANPTAQEMEAHVAGFAALRPTDDYIDAGIPGCERSTYRVLGNRPGAPLAAAGFHMNLVCCEPGKSAPLHNHPTQEVFVALSGRWQVFWGPAGERSVLLERWDTISIAPGVSRGFRNVGDEPAWLMGMASGADPGMINRHRAGARRRSRGGRHPALSAGPCREGLRLSPRCGTAECAAKA